MTTPQTTSSKTYRRGQHYASWKLVEDFPGSALGARNNGFLTFRCTGCSDEVFVR